MSRTVFTFLLLISFFARAERVQHVLDCSTHPISTTTGLVQLSDGSFDFYVLHHRGAAQAPLHDGQLTVADIPTIMLLKEHTELMGATIVLSFNVDECDISNPDLITCYAPRPTTIGGLSVAGYRLRAEKRVLKLSSGDYQERRVAFGYGIRERHTVTWRSLPVNYSEEECRLFRPISD